MAADRLSQLKQAEILVLKDPSHYPAILPAILALTNQPDRPLRRWIANFLTNTFASRALDGQVKETLAATGVVDALSTLMEDADAVVVKSCILCGSLIYPLLFRRICKNPAEATLWGQLGQLKSRIVRVWDQSTNEGVRIACIKFVEKVIATQTPGIKDPRLADKSDISSTIVPLNHPVIHLPPLEAESQGFLDRILSYLIEKPMYPPISPTIDHSDPTLAMAIINALGPLVKTRHTLSSKIINAFLAVDIINIPQNSPDLSKAQLQLRSVSKTIRIQLSHFLRTNAAGPLSNRIDQYLRTSQVNGVVYDTDEISRKRPATEDLSQSVKRQKGEPETAMVDIDPAISAAFLLDPANPMALYDARLIPHPIVVEIIMKSMEILPAQMIEDRINLVRARLLMVPKTTEPVIDTNGDMEDYDPEDIMPSTLEESKLSDDLDEQIPNEEAIITFELPVPTKLLEPALKQEFSASIDRIISSIHTMDTYIPHRAGLSTKSLSLDSLAITEWDKEAWITILSRLSSRLPPSSPVVSSLKERLFEYIMINFRDHMDLTISWLTEEWYSDKLSSNTTTTGGSYEKWSNRIFDNILPFVEMKDLKLFIRFLGDLPFVTGQQVSKLRTLCLDPERIRLGFASLKYLLLLRPPAREACVELCVDLYRNHADTKKSAADLLKRYAPEMLEE